MKQDSRVFEKAAPKTSFEGARGPRPEFQGKVSYKCKSNRHSGCAKLDCPCSCHQEKP